MRELQESERNGRRMSRLPPLTTDSPLIVQGRSEYFRSLSAESGSEDGDGVSLPPLMGLGLRTEVEEDFSNRPVSMHPRMSHVDSTLSESFPVPALPNFDIPVQIHHPNEENRGYFGVEGRRTQSPTPIEQQFPGEVRPESSMAVVESMGSPPAGHTSAASPERHHVKNSFDAGGLVPPRPLFSKRSSSLISWRDSADEDGTSSLSTSFHSQGRKFSGSGVVGPVSGHYQRSPSVCSDASGLPRPSFNFSRPLSRAATPSFDFPARQASSDSHASFVLADESAQTPISMNGDGFPDVVGSDGQPGALPHTHSTFTLPRGKALQRNSTVMSDREVSPSRTWEHTAMPPKQSGAHTFQGQPPPSPPTRPASAAGASVMEESHPRPSLEPSKLSVELARATTQPTPEPGKPSIEITRAETLPAPARSKLSIEVTRSPTQSSQASSRPSEDVSRSSPLRNASSAADGPSATSSDAASTVKPSSRSLHSVAPTMSDMTGEEHVTKAIALHESGHLQESTWHLRHAARQNHPTGMLLYALACRHGWGMRPNPREGVQWLRKAAESAQLEIADDEESTKEGKAVDVVERKTRKAQFALSIYELGVSHMNGWGIEQDKTLALRCFEIAGSWGDVDAMAEAGFCYAQGVGCKKNLKKSAKYYREAEAKGMSMVGNSWYVSRSVVADNYTGELTVV